MLRASVFVSAVLLASASWAQEVPANPAELSEAERTDRAKKHFALGSQHFTLADYEAAVRDFEAGYRYKPMPRFLYNIAHAYDKMGNPKRALNYFKKYLMVSPKAPERIEVEGKILELNQAIADLDSRATELAKPEPAKPEPPKPEPAKPEPVKVEPAAAQPQRGEPPPQAHAEPQDRNLNLKATQPDGSKRRKVLIGVGVGVGIAVATGVVLGVVFGLQPKAPECTATENCIGTISPTFGMQAISQ